MSDQNHAAGESDLLCGTNYSMKGVIGCGSMGLVVEAEHVALGVVVVVKLLHRELASRADFVERMRLEAQALARLRSPHLVTVTDFSVTPSGQPFLVMERLQGATLAEELAARGPFPISEAIEVTRQVLAGLEVAHAAGIVHRDIKPANVFLCRSERPGGPRVVKILDFGIAKVLASASNGSTPKPLRFATAEGELVGTPRCLSPEQAMGRPVDTRTDIYAVGLLLYALLAGAGPFDQVHGALNLVQAHALTKPAPLSASASRSIPPALELAVMRALAKAPDDRFASAALFSAALALIARSASVPPPAVSDATPAVPSRSATVAAVAVPAAQTEAATVVPAAQTTAPTAAPVVQTGEVAAAPAAQTRALAVGKGPRRLARFGTEVVAPAASTVAASGPLTRFGTEVVAPAASTVAASGPRARFGTEVVAPIAPAGPASPAYAANRARAPVRSATGSAPAAIVPRPPLLHPGELTGGPTRVPTAEPPRALRQSIELTGGPAGMVAHDSATIISRRRGKTKPGLVVLVAAIGTVALGLLALEVLALGGWRFH